jgi:hypothetical protein
MSLNDAINQGIADFGKLHQILHGDANTSVTTDGGLVPTVAKTIGGIYGKILDTLGAESTSTLTVGMGLQSLTIPNDKSFQPGQYITVANSGGDKVMFGPVVSYQDTLLLVNVVNTVGTGTDTGWVVTVSGPSGRTGASAYEDAVLNLGFQGSKVEWLNSLKGTNGRDGADGLQGVRGKSAYEVAQQNGYGDSEQAWLASLKGAKGDQGVAGLNGHDGLNGVDGKSAYQHALDNGFTGTEADWLASLKGQNGLDGKSAYQIATDNGYIGTTNDWLDSLKGQDGHSFTIRGTLTDQASLPAGTTGDAYVISGDIWVKGDSGWFNAGQFLGVAGANGRSAYQIAVDNGFVGDEQAWLTSLKGAKGDTGPAGNNGIDGANGATGKSAYQLAVDNGFSGTAIDWLASLKGPKGDTGPAGSGSGNGSGVGASEMIFTDSTTITPTSLDGSRANVFTIKLTADFTIPPIVNGISGQTYLIVLMQDMAGNHKVTKDRLYKFGNNVDPIPSTAGSAIDLLEATYSSTGFFYSRYYNGFTITGIARIGNTKYDTMALAGAAAKDGDLIYVTRSGQMSECTVPMLNPGYYTIAGDPAVAGVPTLKVDNTVHLAWGKGIINVEAGHVLVRDMRFVGAWTFDLSGAAIRHNPGVQYLRMERLVINDCQDGVLSATLDPANRISNGYTIELVDCVLDHNGAGTDGQSHNIYLQHYNRVYALRSRFTNSQYGHDFKTRADYVLMDRCYCSGAGSREVDIPDGGVFHAVNSYFIMNAKVGQNNLIGIGHEISKDGANTQQEYIFRNCLLQNDSGGNFSETFVQQMSTSVTVYFIDCVFLTASPNHCIMDTPFQLVYTGGPIGPEGWDQSKGGIIPKRGTYNTSGGNSIWADNLQPTIIYGPDPTLNSFPPTGSTSTPSVRPESAGPDTTPPAVSLASSAATVSSSGNITLTANASDNVGVAEVDFYRDGLKIGSSTVAPYTCTVTLSSSDNGTLTFTAVAMDAAGNQTTSAPVQVVVNVMPDPTVYPFSMDSQTTSEFNAAISAATSPGKRMAGANAIVSAFAPYRLYIYQENTLVVPMTFSTPMVANDDGTNVTVNTGTPDPTDPLVAADITSGTWHFELQGAADYSRSIKGSVGPTGSGKMIEINDNPAPGTGVSISFSMTLDRSIDGLS